MTAADARAYAWCNLGPLAPGESSIGDDHVQGTGLCMTKGTIRLLGVVRPAAGTVVELAYSDGQSWLARLPRRLRVLSSFTNPLGAPITTLSVGCDLAYVESRKPVTSNPTNQQANPSVPEQARRDASPPMSAAWVVGQILQEIGITAAGACPLTNWINRDSFNMSEGYVQELGKLLASEGYFARMNEAGLLEYISKDQGTGTSLVLLENDLIEINPVNTGELPGDGVYARYTTLRLKPPGDLSDNERKKRNWESEESISSRQLHIQRWTEYIKNPVSDSNGNPVYKQKRDLNGNPIYSSRIIVQTGATETTEYTPELERVYETKAIEREERIYYYVISKTVTNYDSWDRVTTRVTETQGLWGTERTETAYVYKRRQAVGINKPSDYSDVEIERTISYSPTGPIRMQLGEQGSYWVFRNGLSTAGEVADPPDTYLSSAREVRYEKNTTEGISKTITRNWVPYINSQDGRESFNRANDSRPAISRLFDAIELVEEGGEVRIRTEREYGLQRRPAESARLTDANRKAPETEELASVVWQLGSPASIATVELSPPYVPEDRLSWDGSAWVLTLSDAPQKALNYARIENRLRLGHRNGLSLQLLPEHVPPVPFGLIYVRLRGCTAAYRLNGTTFTISEQGCVATTDALFWGAVDGEAGADPWFPVPPGSSSLPAPLPITANPNPRPANAVSIPSGFNPSNPNLASLFASLPTGVAPTWQRQISPTVLIRPYTEAVDLDLGIGGGASVDQPAWIASPPVDLDVGLGAGFDVAALLTAGLGVGVVIDVVGQQVATAPLLAAIPSGAEILDTSSLQGQYPLWELYVPSQSGVAIFVAFQLTTATTITAVGMYDHGQNGLSEAHGFSLWNDFGPNMQPVTLNYGGGVQEITIPSGTTATLQGIYRTVALTTPQTLQPGFYAIAATLPTPGADQIAALGVSAGSWNSAITARSGRVLPANPSATPQVDLGFWTDPEYEGILGAAYSNFTLTGNNQRVPVGPMLIVQV